MSKSITVSAPGKLLLFGEHAVVHGFPCIVTAVNQYMECKAEPLSEPILVLGAPDVGIEKYEKPLDELGNGEIPKGARFVEEALRSVMVSLPASRSRSGGWSNHDTSGLHLTITSAFKSTVGFGSSSAATICTLKAINELWELNLNPKELFDLSYQAVLAVQGGGSGADLAAALLGGTLLYQLGGKRMEPIGLEINKVSLVIGYSGTKADTMSMLQIVADRIEHHPALADVYRQMGQLSLEADDALRTANWKNVGKLMNRNQQLLDRLGVSTSKLDRMIAAAIEAEAYGAKLSGAGGGDCMIALCSRSTEKQVKEAIARAGGTVVNAQWHADVYT